MFPRSTRVSDLCADTDVRRHRALRGVDLDVERGKINVIIGGSGQGKTVLMKHLMGLI